MDPASRRLLIAILAVFGVLALSYSFAARLKWAPDEPAHFIYIRSLAVDHTPPPIAHHDTPNEDSEETHEGHQPPLYYALMAVPFALLRAMGVANDTIWRVLRLLDIPIGLMWIYAVYVLAREYFERDGYALAVAAFVALIPTASYMAGVINNETLISLLFTSAMLPILRFFKNGSIMPKPAAILGLLIGLAILAKAQGLVLVPVLVVVAYMVCRRNRYANWPSVLRSVAIALGVAVAVSGWWFVRSKLVNGAWMPQSLTDPTFVSPFAVMLGVPGFFLRASFFASCGAYAYFWTPFWVLWSYVGTVVPLVRVMGALTVVVIVGLVMRIRRGGVDTRSLALLLLTCLLVYLAWMRYALFVDKWAHLQGRLFLSVASVVGIVWVLGFDGLLKSDRAKRIGLAIGLLLMLLANVGIIFLTTKLYA